MAWRRARLAAANSACLGAGVVYAQGWYRSIWSCMEIRIESLIEGARRARGTVVIVDVFPGVYHGGGGAARGPVGSSWSRRSMRRCGFGIRALGRSAWARWTGSGRRASISAIRLMRWTGLVWKARSSFNPRGRGLWGRGGDGRDGDLRRIARHGQGHGAGHPERRPPAGHDCGHGIQRADTHG